MTVSSTINKRQYLSNGSQLIFPYDFKIFADTDLEVYQTDTAGVETLLTLVTDYSVTGVGDDGGGNVVLTAAIPVNYYLTIQRSVPLTQDTDLVENDPFPADVLEDSLDKLTILTQQMNEVLDRCIKFSTAYTGTLPDPITGVPTSERTFLSKDTDGSLSFYPVPSTVMDFSAVYDALVASIALKSTIAKIQNGSYLAWPGTSGSDAYIITPVPAVTAYTEGLPVVMKADVSNTGACTLNINGVGAKAIKKKDGVALVDLANNDIVANQNAVLYFDTTEDAFILLNPDPAAAFVESKQPGDVVQTVQVWDATYKTGVKAIPYDNTSPQDTEGDSYMEATITFTNASHEYEVFAIVHLSNTLTSRLAATIFRDGSSTVIATGLHVSGEANEVSQITLFRGKIPVPGAGTYTFRVRAGSNGGTTSFNGVSGAGLYNGSLCSCLIIRELKPT